jgi:hypothetical protein
MCLECTHVTIQHLLLQGQGRAADHCPTCPFIFGFKNAARSQKCSTLLVRHPNGGYRGGGLREENQPWGLTRARAVHTGADGEKCAALSRVARAPPSSTMPVLSRARRSGKDATSRSYRTHTSSARRRAHRRARPLTNKMHERVLLRTSHARTNISAAESGVGSGERSAESHGRASRLNTRRAAGAAEHKESGWRG